MSAHEIGYGPLPAQRADVLLPEGDEHAPVLVHLHGGGLEGGSRHDDAGLHGRLRAAGVAVVSPDYRLYPQARFPEFVEDAAACVAWVRRELPGRPLLVGGSSAGAYLAMMLRFDRRWLAAAGLAVTDVAGWLFDGGQPTTHFNVLAERGLDPARVVVDEAAPLFHVDATTEPAPTLVLLAEDDIPGRREQTDLLLATLARLVPDDDTRFEVIEGQQHSEYLRDDSVGQDRFVALVLDLVARAVAAGPAVP